MPLPESHPDSSNEDHNAITCPGCSFDSCGNDARWRQFNPPSRAHPLFLCTEHWLQVRMDRPELIVAYGWLTSFTKKELSDPYGSDVLAAPGAAAYEIPPVPPDAAVEVVGGQT